MSAIDLLADGFALPSLRRNSATTTGIEQKEGFAASLRLQMAQFRLMGLDAVLGAGETAAGPLDALSTARPEARIAASGRNTNLFDPESAYRMMTLINGKDVNYKAEFAEMSEMQDFVSGLQGEAKRLSSLQDSSDVGSVRAAVQDFAAAYNRWIDRFDEELHTGGILAGTQAAHVAQWELEQSIDYPFHGAAAGVRGMEALGLTVDPTTDLVTLDTARLDAMLSANPAGTLATLREFGTAFARSAELLNAENNFIPNRLERLDDVIDYLHTHLPALREEFGSGDPVRPQGRVAAALASYEAAKNAGG